MKRLNFILSMIDKCETFADIGCDHGILSEKVAKNGLAKRIFACDISEPSLIKAKELFKAKTELKLMPQDLEISFHCCDGFDEVPYKVDFAAICGMGGKEIIKILENNKSETVVAQPQTDSYLLRDFFSKNNYLILRDEVIIENGKFYDVIKAKNMNFAALALTEKTQLTELQKEFGAFYKEKSIDKKKKLELLERNFSKYKKTEKVEKFLKDIMEAKKWQQ